MSKVLVFADIYFETQYFVEKIPSNNQVAISPEIINMIGSKTLNASRIMSKAGDFVYIFGRVGEDSFGETAKQVIEQKYNLHTKYLSTVFNQKTGQLVVITDTTGQSSITLNFGVNKLIDESYLPHISPNFPEFDTIYCATNLPLNLLYSLINQADKVNVPVFIDVPNQHKEIDLSKLNGATFLAPNRQEAELLTDIKIENIEDAKKACNKIREKFFGNIIITLDKDGCIVLEEGKISADVYPVSPKREIDSTGAGDIFRGIFVSEYLKSQDIPKSILKAQRVASESVLIKGVNNTIESLNLT